MMTTSLDGKIVIATKDKSSLQLFHYERKGLLKGPSDTHYKIPAGCSIGKLFYLNDGSLAVITEKHGIYIYPYNKKTSCIQLSPGKLADHRIRDVYLYTQRKTRKLFITYSNPFGSGVTECTITKNWSVKAYKTYNKLNSELKTNFVHQVTSDLKGNAWFRYSVTEEEGVSRLSPSGEWDHYNLYNSELGDSGVTLMVVEKKNEGLKGNNIWFVSAAGLSRLDYGGKKDVWKLYGDKQTFVNKLLRFLGLASYFTDAILDIIDIAILPDSILIANKYAIYHFTADNINRFIPETVKGIDDNQISHISYKIGYARVFIKLPLKQDPSIRSVMLLNLEKRNWHKMNYWHLKRTYPDNIHLLSLDKNNDLVIFIYSSGEIKSALYNYSTFELMETQIIR